MVNFGQLFASLAVKPHGRLHLISRFYEADAFGSATQQKVARDEAHSLLRQEVELLVDREEHVARKITLLDFAVDL